MICNDLASVYVVELGLTFGVSFIYFILFIILFIYLFFLLVQFFFSSSLFPLE